MADIKLKIERFVEDIISKKNYPLLDILWTFSYSIPSMSGYYNKKHNKENKEIFKEWLGIVCKRNLQKKYRFKVSITEQMGVFLNFLNDIDFFSKEMINENKELFKTVLFEKSAYILIKNIPKRFKKLSNLDREILSFLLNYIPLKVDESMKAVEDIFLPELSIRKNKEGEIIYYEIRDIRKWTYIFNCLFDENDENLKEQKFKIESYNGGPWPFEHIPIKQYKDYSLWPFGDKLVNLGAGYWVFDLTSGGYITVYLMIPSFVYEKIKEFKEKLPKLENCQERADKIENQYEQKNQEEMKKEKVWDIKEFKLNKQRSSKTQPLEFTVKIGPSLANRMRR